MKRLYISSLILLFALTSCENSEVNELGGSTTLDEQVNYSTFLAKVVDDFAEQSVATKVATLQHIGFYNNTSPDLAVLFDNDAVVNYAYNATTKAYETVAEIPAGAKALYMYSTSNINNDALVGAQWPVEFNAMKKRAIELHNLKSRLVVSYKYLTSDIADVVTDVKLGNVYSDSELKLSNDQLICLPKGDRGEMLATEVQPCDDVEELDASYNFGTREIFVAPQTLTAYDSYVSFTIDGKEYQYKFIEDLPLLANRRYKLLFEIGKQGTEPAISLKVVANDIVADWNDKEFALSINANTYQWSEWDGATYEPFTVGAGTVEDPYKIKSAAQLAFLMQKCADNTVAYLNNKHYLLDINIDWKGYAWSILGKFGNQITGSFDGNNRKIKNMNISTLGGNVGFIGLCGQNYSLKNLTLDGVKFRAEYTSANAMWGSCVGGFIGNMPAGCVVENCHILNSEVSGNYYVGGIVGSSSGSVIGCSVVNTKISALYDEDNENSKKYIGAAGGIVGVFYSAAGKKIHYCLSSGNTISGYSEHVGGIVGYPWTKFPELVKCYAANLTTNSPSGMFYALSGLSREGTAEAGYTVNANWIKSSFHSVDANVNDAADRYSQFASSSYMAQILNDAEPDVNTPATEGWTWMPSSVEETLSPTPKRNN